MPWPEHKSHRQSAEIELLVEMEHDRWVEERRRDAWTCAPGVKDIDNKASPHMVPWNELSDQVTEWDRVFVRRLPRFLAGAGFQIVRLGAVTTDANG